MKKSKNIETVIRQAHQASADLFAILNGRELPKVGVVDEAVVDAVQRLRRYLDNIVERFDPTPEPPETFAIYNAPDPIRLLAYDWRNDIITDEDDVWQRLLGLRKHGDKNFQKWLDAVAAYRKLNPDYGWDFDVDQARRGKGAVVMISVYA